MVQADTALSIPLNPQFSSLNIAQAVLLVAYEWAAADEDAPAERMSDHATRPATKDELLNLFEHLERALDQSGFLRNKAMRPSMVFWAVCSGPSPRSPREANAARFESVCDRR